MTRVQRMQRRVREVSACASVSDGPSLTRFASPCNGSISKSDIASSERGCGNDPGSGRSLPDDLAAFATGYRNWRAGAVPTGGGRVSEMSQLTIPAVKSTIAT
jgi:hypothetical protein